MNKERIKGIVTGFVLCALLSTSVLVVGAQTVTRNITYGVGVILNGQHVHFDYDSRPFVMGGRTFLPLRTMAELLDLPVNFDAATNNAIVGQAIVRHGTPMSELFFDGSTTTVRQDWGGHRSSSVIRENEGIMGGTVYNNVITLTARASQTIGSPTVQQNALFNLNRQYNWLNITIGRIDGTVSNDGNVRIYADDVLIEDFIQGANALPTELRLFVEDVRLITIQVEHIVHWGSGATFAIAGFAE
jgi:hypothetical protein